ncbi:hypothetical protein Thiowin_01269 [Thiorhodovibrio winogradskyi]|uniref:Uncharacterized protein n=1 Tax=Thiorhodovibrio winogradskyi TaxID=77007 RepID=A0ABZ0S850_9GAMM|nr:hypothetical protein [Thiorhodovibrio winogradskyi]
MIFDALTISGLLVAIVSGGFLVGIVSHNGAKSQKSGRSVAKPNA